MRPLIVGGHGMLGRAFPREIERIPRKNKDWFSIAEAIGWRNPDVVINCAGVTGFYRSEENPFKTYLANIAVPIELATACYDVGATLIQFSTFYVGDGLYYKSKKLMEQAFEDFTNVSLIYLPTLFDDEVLPAPYDENFHIAYTQDVADWVLLNIDMCGEEHFLCNAGHPSRQEFLEEVNYYTGEVEKVVTSPRSNNAKEAYGDLTQLRHWREAVDSCFGGNK